MVALYHVILLKILDYKSAKFLLLIILSIENNYNLESSGEILKDHTNPKCDLQCNFREFPL